MKICGFFTSWGTRLYLITLLAAQPYWVIEIYANFTFFNRGQALFTTTRPLEPLFRCGVRMRFSPTPHVADPDLGTRGGSSPPAFSCTSSSVGMGVR